MTTTSDVTQHISQIKGPELDGYMLGLSHAFTLAFSAFGGADSCDVLARLDEQWAQIRDEIEGAMTR